MAARCSGQPEPRVSLLWPGRARLRRRRAANASRVTAIVRPEAGRKYRVCISDSDLDCESTWHWQAMSVARPCSHVPGPHRGSPPGDGGRAAHPRPRSFGRAAVAAARLALAGPSSRVKTATKAAAAAPLPPTPCGPSPGSAEKLKQRRPCHRSHRLIGACHMLWERKCREAACPEAATLPCLLAARARCPLRAARSPSGDHPRCKALIV